MVKRRGKLTVKQLSARFNSLVDAMKGIVRQVDTTTVTVNIIVQALLDKGIITEEDIENATRNSIRSEEHIQRSEVRPEDTEDGGSDLDRDGGVLSNLGDGEDTGISTDGESNG